MGKRDEILSLSIKKTAHFIKRGELSPVELVNKTMEEIEKRNPNINAYISVDFEGAINAAKKAEEEIKNGIYKGPLHGIPLGVKDNIHVKNMKTTFASKVYKDNISTKDAFSIQCLKEAGAIIIGKHNMDEFASGTMGDRSYFGPVKNPHSLTRMAGGSSSGSAAAVAANLCFAAIGTDTSGSIRIPASFCGVIGMKPTYGRVSLEGVGVLSRTQDHAGIITRTIYDNALILNMVGNQDFTRFIGHSLNEITIGIVTNLREVNEEIAAKMETVMKKFEKAGATITRINIPQFDSFIDAQQQIISFEIYEKYAELLEKHDSFIDEEVKLRMLIGKLVHRNDYEKALTRRNEAILEFANIFNQIDAILTPTVPILPPIIHQRVMNENDIFFPIEHMISTFTAIANLIGFPSLSVPVGFSNDGLPIGIQLIGNEWDERKLYQIGFVLEC